VNKRCLRAFAPLLLLCTRPAPAADDVKVTASAVEDQRFSDEKYGGLTVELLLKGGAVADVKALRVKVTSARDDLGSVLTRPDKDERPADFEEFSPDRQPLPKVRLKSPRRDAASMELAGEIELFLPGRDPATKQRFDQFLKRLDAPIANPALKAAKVEITPLSAKEYAARQVKNRPTKEQIIAEGKKHGASDEEIKKVLEMMDALASLGGEAPTETSVLLETKDPDGRIIAIDVVRADGAELHSSSRGSNGGREQKLQKIDLDAKPPADAALLVTLRTAKSVVTVPFSLKEVALP
jgi:hypothetical protein